ncbi:hypothetical protein [Metallosphaera javensis (ex Sakai et al. 2022)]|uniref:hypothetical protein n=1 Tax=Metallosphaera javensis (ex Sakai et al. 2022) TaxID=2775498 RepID=UPI00258DAB11|nr:MAG: hypothetical protein MjAS7_2955 [Metallosphaera javensis (ex Sakai et al. 2022)]
MYTNYLNFTVLWKLFQTAVLCYAEGKDNVPKLEREYLRLKHEVYVLFDGDVRREGSWKENHYFLESENLDELVASFIRRRVQQELTREKEREAFNKVINVIYSSGGSREKALLSQLLAVRYLFEKEKNIRDKSTFLMILANKFRDELLKEDKGLKEFF